MKKKILSLMLTGALAMSLFAGCGSDASNSGTEASVSNEETTETSLETSDTSSDVSTTASTDETTAAAAGEDYSSHWVLVKTYYEDLMDHYTFDEKGLIVRDGTDTDYTLYEYYDNNAEKKEEWYGTDYDSDVVKLQSYYCYDEAGNKTEEMAYGYKTVYEYYDGGNLKSETQYIDYNTAADIETTERDWQYFGRIDYDEKGNETYEETYSYAYNFLNDKELFVYSFDLTYDENGNLTERLQDFDDYRYTYDEDGDLLHQELYYTETGEKAFYNEIINEYTVINGQKLVTHNEMTDDYEGVDYRTVVDYTYDENGNVLTKNYDSYYCYEGERSDAFTDDNYAYYIEYEYDENGRKVKSVSTAYGEVTTYEYSYDEYGNTVERVETSSEGTYTTTYSYDPVTYPAGKTGDIFVRKTTENYDGEVSTYYTIYRWVD